MAICKNCGLYMSSVMSFSKGGNQKFYQCPKCKKETKHISIDDSELNFGELLHKEMINSTKGKN